MCAIEGCERPPSGHGWCRLHYGRWKRTGDPEGVIRIVGDTEKRFWSKVNKDGPIPKHRPDLGRCWVWTAKARANGGYGAIWLTDRVVRSHRFAYELLVGPIPDGLELDHLCRVRGCVNPAHLEPVTQQVNITRGEAGGHNATKTHCVNGHPFDEANTITRSNGGRSCRQCGREAMRRYRTRQVEAQAAQG